ncbi:response regulator transcription factor [Brevibacillus sp. HB1.4B]|uniref:response regulator transcription factor n=1 Tax=Brevibacillus TaxID=55080 RepID=UPI00156AA5D3|nr:MULTISPECIES: response regulator transcription factor [unclassified Brevibacillus]NRS20475.1 response regulator transcription factor [Brevibacillus sp. HB1.4B]NTU34005.1 response regulator transcription factor [Brevibacillus sp. HB1.1]
MKVLVVEDDKTIADGLHYSLSSEGYEVVLCEGKQTAIETIKQQRFDIYLLDLTLPDGNGYEICEYVKENQEAPVIFLTACDDEINVVRGLDMGADDYITKPFRIRELISRMKSSLRHYQKDHTPTDNVKIGNVVVNTKLAKVYKGTEEVMLTALEYRLLLAFINNRGQVLSRNQLLEGIWDLDGNFINDNTLSVYIKRLREKLEDDSQNPKVIETVRGLGYRMSGSHA